MKVTMEFNLPEEIHEYMITTKANTMHSHLATLSNTIRSHFKHDSYAPTLKEIKEGIDSVLSSLEYD